MLEVPNEGSMTEGIFREFDCLKACSAMAAGHLGASQFEFDDRQMYFTSLPLSSVNCLETTLLV